MQRLPSLLLVGFLPAVSWAEDAAPPPDYLADWQQKMQAILPRGYVCHHSAAPPVIDGRIDDTAWAGAAWTADFVDIEGSAKPAPRFRTRAKMLWDDEYFYIAAEMEEPHVWGTITKHDEVIFQDPDFEVFIDPNGDSHEYYEFEMNALNTGWDLYLPKPYKDGGKADNGWEIPGLKTAVHVDGTLNHSSDQDRGWTVELAFPWKVLGVQARRPAPPQEGDQWRVGFSRVEWQIDIQDGKYVKKPKTPENNWIWSPQGVIDMHRPERWGYVQFSRKAPGTVTLTPDPTTPLRNALQEIYYAQKVFTAKQQRWAATMDELGLKPAGGLAEPPVLKLTPDGFDCTAGIRLPDGSISRLTIRQDSLIQPASKP